MQRRETDESAATGQPVEKDVLGDAQCADDIELLHHHHDARTFGLALGTWVVGLSFELDFSAIAGGEAGENVRERGFACAVAADERVHFSAPQVEAEVHQHRDRVALLQSGDSEELSGVHHDGEITS